MYNSLGCADVASGENMANRDPSVGHWVDGVGDEVVVVGGGIVAVFMTLLAVWLLTSGRG